MNKYLIFIITALTISNYTYSYQPNLHNGENIFRQCRMCHGKNGDKSPMGQAKAINSLSQEEIYQALLARKNGEIDGAGNAVKARLSEQDMQDVAAFIQTLNK